MTDTAVLPKVRLEQQERYRFKVSVDQPSGWSVVVDENPPLGASAGPSPARMLAAAVGHCLAASFAFCMEKSRQPIATGLVVEVAIDMQRNDKGRLRIGKLDVDLILPPDLAADEKPLTRCLELFEDYCVVTASVRQGIPVNVRVDGKPLAT